MESQRPTAIDIPVTFGLLTSLNEVMENEGLVSRERRSSATEEEGLKKAERAERLLGADEWTMQQTARTVHRHAF